MRVWAGLAMLAVLTGAAPATSQEADQVEEIVVVARRAGAPMWTVTRGDSTVILVGALSGVPRDFAWRPEALEAATARSQRILYPQEARASVTDIMRLLWRIRTIAILPDGTTTADYLPAALQARVETLMADQGEAWRRASLVGLGRDLMEQGGRQRGGQAAVDVVRRAARTVSITGEPVGIVRGDELIDGLIRSPPGQYVPCIEAAAAAAEAGPEGAAERLEARRDLRVAEVVASPLDQALALCWPWGDPDVAPLLRSQWREATQAALGQSGVTMAVTGLRILAEPAGVLDQLEAEGLDVVGPEWKARD